MMKEIHEQPRAILDTLNSKLKDGKIDLSDVGLSDEDIKRISSYLYCCVRICISYRGRYPICNGRSWQEFLYVWNWHLNSDIEDPIH